MRRSIKVGVIRRKSSGGIGRLYEEDPTGLGCSCPKSAVFRRCPSGPKFIEGREVVGGIGERLRHDTRDEKNHRVLFIHLGADYPPPKACHSALGFAMTHRGQKLLCFSLVVVNTLPTPIAAKSNDIANYSSPSGAGVSSFGVPSVLHDQKKYP